MNRVEVVQHYINNIFDSITEIAERHTAYIHSYGVSQCCAFLAQLRGLDAELSTIIGSLHDVYLYKTGLHSLHSHNGTEMIRVAFKYELKDMFSEEEQIIIKSAIYHHTDKEHIHDKYDEMLKDCDVLQQYLFNITADCHISKRLVKVAKELNITLFESPTLAYKKIKPFYQTCIGDIAEELALKEIAGTKDNSDYMEIIKYYPENFAFNELNHAWCAAFVYHCCIKAGLELPLRTPNNVKYLANCRFACVVAWYQWAKEHGFSFDENDSFIPQRGILLYITILFLKNTNP